MLTRNDLQFIGARGGYVQDDGRAYVGDVYAGAVMVCLVAQSRAEVERGRSSSRARARQLRMAVIADERSGLSDGVL